MLVASDHDLGEATQLLREVGLDAAFFVPTKTGLEKSILDATESVRLFLRRCGAHEYVGQQQGPEGKVTKTAFFVTAKELIPTTVSLYRPRAKGKEGDPRIWFSELRNYAAPNNLLALVFIGDSLYVSNLSRDEVRKSLKDASSALNLLRSRNEEKQEQIVQALLAKLRSISRLGWIKTTTVGDTGIGATLEHQLGIRKNSSKAPDFQGVELKAKRQGSIGTRSNLFAKVPDWSISHLKSSQQILDRYGYFRDSVRKLYCSVSAKAPNSQGLYLYVSEDYEVLRERHTVDSVAYDEVCAWSFAALQNDLINKHAETFWVNADSKKMNGTEYFRYISVTHTKSPLAAYLPILCRDGVVTVDHLIKRGSRGKVTEKGPLFKINPSDLGMLFPTPITYTL